MNSARKILDILASIVVLVLLGIAVLTVITIAATAAIWAMGWVIYALFHVLPFAPL